VCFPLNVSILHSSTLVVIADGEHLTCGSFSLGKTVRLGSLEFIVDCFNSLSLSPKGNDSGVIFMGTAHSGSPSLRTILVDSTDEFYTTSSGEGSFGFPISWRSNMVTPPTPITTTSRPDDAPAPQTTAMVPLRTIIPQPETGFPPE
jgi:hypothetical protein